jgi:hypothetical protein
MERQKANLLRILVCGAVLAFSSGVGWTAYDASQTKSASFFSQGQAVYNPQDVARSRQEAVHDLQVQAVTQAIGTFLNPSQMGSQFGPIQDRVLKQSERYVETYQVFSEAPMGSLFRVTGQATVSMELLRKDLLRLGFAVKEGVATASPPAQPEVKPAPVTPPAVLTPPAAVSQGTLPGRRAREATTSKRKCLWVVAERWGKEWYLPKDRRDPRGLFAQSIMQESQDYEWSLVFPESDTVSVDPSGKVSQNRALSLAVSLGIEKVVLGTTDLQMKGNQDASLAVHLRVLDGSTAKSLGDIHKEMGLGRASDQQGASEMAFALVPQLDRLLRETSHSGEAAQPAQQKPEPVQPAQDKTESARPAQQKQEPVKAGPGEWTLLIRSDHQYAYWEGLEKVLAERFKSMRVRSIELGKDEARVRIDGVDGESLASLQGAQVREGIRVQVDGVSPEAHAVRVTFVGSESARPEPVQ